MQPVVRFADIEAWTCEYLRDRLRRWPERCNRNVHVATTVPDERTDRMVIVRRDGGPRLDVVREAARLGINVWATTEPEVRDLTELVRGLLADSAGVGPVRRASEVAGPIAVPEESGQPRRYFTVELVARARVGSGLSDRGEPDKPLHS